MQIKNSVVIITGAASGIGRAAAITLAARGAKLALGDIDEKGLQEVAQEITRNDGSVITQLLNVCDERSIQSLMDLAIEKFGQINILIASAGIVRDSLLVTRDKTTGKVKKWMTNEQWQQVIDVNLTGVFLSIREASIRMINHAWSGVLIPISSMNKSGEIGQLNYSSAKVSVALWPKIIAGEFHAMDISNIRIAAIAPGYVDTPLLNSLRNDAREKFLGQVPKGRLIPTKDIVDSIFFIIENESVHGVTLEISGGVIASRISR